MKKIMIIAILVPFSLSIWAQVQVKGKVISAEHNNPLEFANVVLETVDSTFVSGTTTNEGGNFAFEKVTPGNYRVKVTMMGFVPTAVLLDGLRQSIDLGNISLASSTVELDQINVTASSETAYSDRRVIFPTDQQKSASTNGINILSAMMLPRLEVNPLTNEVKASDNGEIVFCINGAKVELNDIRGLSPGEIRRIEYHDNPGLRYGSASAVIDYIIHRPVTGGVANLDLSNSPNTIFGNDQVAFRVNHKKSEFGLNYNVSYRHPYHLWADSKKDFYFEDNNKIQRVEKGIPSDMTETAHRISLNYNLMENDKYYFTATFRQNITKDFKKRRAEMFTSDNPSDVTRIYAGGDSKTYLPALDVYYYRNLGKKQALILNVVGTYINSNSDQTYEEKKEDHILSDILSKVDGDKYSLIGEGIYENNLSAGTIGIGFKHTQSWADNEYTGTVEDITELNQSDSYLYAEFRGKQKKFSYTAGIGGARSWYHQKGEKEYQYYSFKPTVTLQYNFTNQIFTRLRGRIENISPSLSQLSAVEQYVDTLQIRRGNPNLKPYLEYITDFTFEYRKKLFTGSIYLMYRNNPKAIMEETLREDNKFILTNLNQKRWQGMGGNTTVRVGPIRNILTFSLTGGVNHYLSEGLNYSHTYTNWYYRASVMAAYKKFMGMFQIQSRSDSFRGESMNSGEEIHMLMFMYNQGKFSVGAGMMLPFSDNYKRENKSRNQYTPSSSLMYSNDFSRMLLLKFTWNFNYGRKFKGGNKRLHNEDTDPGIMKAN